MCGMPEIYEWASGSCVCCHCVFTVVGWSSLAVSTGGRPTTAASHVFKWEKSTFDFNMLLKCTHPRLRFWVEDCRYSDDFYCRFNKTNVSLSLLAVLHWRDHEQARGLLPGRQSGGCGPRASVWKQDGADRGQRQRAEKFPGWCKDKNLTGFRRRRADSWEVSLSSPV